MKASCLLFFGITAQVTANPVKQREETRQPERIVELSVALKPESRQLLEQALDNLSSPSSSRYGQYLGREAAKALLRPRQASTDVVRGWLSQAGIPANHILTDEQFVYVQTNAERVEALLGVHYNATRGSQTFAVSSLPQNIQDHVMTIQYAPAHRTTACPLLKANISSPGANTKYHPLDQHLTNARVEWERCKSEITPACLRRLYHAGDYQARHEEKNLVGVAGFDGVSSIFTEALAVSTILLIWPCGQFSKLLNTTSWANSYTDSHPILPTPISPLHRYMEEPALREPISLRARPIKMSSMPLQWGKMYRCAFMQPEAETTILSRTWSMFFAPLIFGGSR